MQNKGVITFFAVLLTLVCLFYLSFTFATRPYYKQAQIYAAGDQMKESQYLDSLASKKVWLGYTLKKSRAMELNLGLDLKGGMSVIMELDVAEVLKSLSNHNPDPKFNQALENASVLRSKSNTDFITLFIQEYHKLDPGARLSAIFSTFELKDKITPQSSDADVEKVLRSELKSAIDNSFNVLRNRIDRFGVVAPNIQRLQTEGRISIELPGIKEKERVRALLQGSANLEFWETFDQKDIHQALLAANTIIRDSLARAGQTGAIDTTAVTTGTTTAASAATQKAVKDSVKNNNLEENIAKIEKADSSSLAGEQNPEAKTTGNDAALESFKKDYPLFYLLGVNPQMQKTGPDIGTVNKRDTALVNKYLNMRLVQEALPRQLVARWGVKAVDPKEEMFVLYALKASTRDGRPALEGDVVTSAKDEFSQNSSAAEVSMSMNSDGTKKWARLTKENIGKCVAIVLDNMVYTAPVVNDEIPNGTSRISGHFTTEEAKDLANVLKSGKMSAPARIVQEDVIGPSLGQESINKGFFAFLLALVILMVYLIFVYGVIPGIIADIALLLNLFFTMGVLASFHAVLTLSGIAGMVLALHVAVDANVLIYERIKEEIRGGKKVKNAVEEGYHKAFSAIFDSNLTAIITGVILYVFGTGPIRGFAFTMIGGIVISFFTAVFLTRVVYESFMERGKLLNLTFNTAWTKNFLVNPKFNLMKNRRLIYGVNIAIVAICLIALFTRGLNQGIDFTGGRNYRLAFNQPVNTVEAQTLLLPLFENHPPMVTTIGTSDHIRVSTNYKFNDNSPGVDAEITQKLYQGLKHLLPEGTTYQQFSEKNILSSQTVQPSIAADIKFHAYLAVFFAVIAIGLYILLRFRDVSYSVGSIVALICDAIFIMGMYAILWGFLPFSLEVDQTFIGAILTAIGYSMNDKVVIFDRVREYTHLYPKEDKYPLFNEALNSTLDRTFNTSMSAFLVMMVILFFAGDAIRSFSFAMLLGVVVGTFSSLFTAAPIAYEIQRRKKGKVATSIKK